MTTSTTDPAGSSDDLDRGFFGQPRPLANLFGVEMWERFSFYGMQGILLIYLYYSADQGGLGIDKATATGIVGAYGGAVYLATILGAWLADRVIGAERTLFYAASIVMLGHIALAVVPDIAGVAIGLPLIALGSGGVKANATSLVGSLYSEQDERRDAGFSLFYMGINIGAFVGPLLTGWFQENKGFHWGFGLAAIGMFLGLVQYSIGRKRLPDASRVVPNPLEPSERIRYAGALVAFLIAIGALVAFGWIDAGNLSDWVIGITIAAALAYFALLLTSSQVSALERSRVWSFVPMFITNAVFWSLYQQQFTVVTIYSDERVDRDFFGWTMPVSWVQSINPVFIIALAPVFAAVWTRLGSRQPSTPVKFGIGTVLMGLAFLMFLPLPSGENTVNLWALAAVLLVFTLAELFISPPGLSLSTKLAPAKYHTQMVALYFLSIALGTAMSGRLAAYYDPDDETGYFLIIGLVAIAVGVLLLLFVKPIRKLMAGVH
ncbi:MFS transporter [Nocardioides sp. Root1257]|uniref:peptide MFS transporter n=1 Tax=unclassified Nocardioides TaxID=2615069 RepID=UPI000701860B|nr:MULTISPECIES: peptide MFS transporter [unclassified Nocardioides]KQW48453.1 MFS transporter [Nocardioides sp. Root1257]KRC47627.1 MFS transporter [Nocardioides sp. Root224]